MTLRLGPDAEDLELTFTRGASWWATLVSVDDTEAQVPVAYPEGVSIELRVGSSTAQAVIAGAEATIRFTQAQVATIVAEGPQSASLWWSDGIDVLPWAIGTVYFDG